MHEGSVSTHTESFHKDEVDTRSISGPPYLYLQKRKIKKGPVRQATNGSVLPLLVTRSVSLNKVIGLSVVRNVDSPRL